VNAPSDLNASRRGRRSARIVGLGALLLIAAAVPVALAELSTKPKVLADFEDLKAITVRPTEAETTRVPLDRGQALQITTDAAASWPSVYIEPKDGKWNLSGFDGVEMDVQNPQEVAVRVLLSVNNPGADGEHHCNCDSVTVAPHGKATVVVPFGFWHGNPDHPLDLTNIVAVQVLLDRPGRAHRFTVSNIRAVTFDRGNLKEMLADPFFQHLKPVFGRGVNLGDALDAPQEGDWGFVLKEEYFKRIGHAEVAAPYRIEPKFFDRVDWAVHQALDHHLVPILNMHHYLDLMDKPDEHRERFLALWEQIAEHYKDYSPLLALELLNEPQGNLTSEKWNRLLADGIAVVRRTNPTREIVVGPAGWNAIAELSSLELPKDDRHLVVTVHYYSPFHFTHQGADWAGPESQAWLGTKWTGTKSEQQAIGRDFDTAISWAIQHRRPIYLGEFGAYSKADLPSRARWTEFVAKTALERKMGFAYWEFGSNFALFDTQADEWIKPLRDAVLAPSAPQ
jgi:endoglucanase